MSLELAVSDIIFTTQNIKSELMEKFKVAYISRIIYPDSAASALQMIRMAAAFAVRTGDTHFFVHDLNESEKQIREQYNIVKAPLKIWRLHLKRWPSLLVKNAKLRSLCFNSIIAGILILHPGWRNTPGKNRVLFVRSRLEILYWGKLRTYLRGLSRWIFVCEIHGLDIPLINGQYDLTSSRAKTLANAFRNFDFVFTPMDGLAKAINEMTNGDVVPEVLPHGTGLKRLAASPIIKLQPTKIQIGYVGTVDLLRGIDCVLSALRFLPDGIQLRIIGRISKGDLENKPAWLTELLDDPKIAGKVELFPPVPYKDVAAAIDACDIVIQPAGENIHASRYAAPLKLFEYMARGKPIIAAGVVSHLKILKDKINARIYKPGDPKDLAKCIMELVEQPQQAQLMAKTVWEQSAKYTYDVRVKRILTLAEQV